MLAYVTEEESFLPRPDRWSRSSQCYPSFSLLGRRLECFLYDGHSQSPKENIRNMTADSGIWQRIFLIPRLVFTQERMSYKSVLFCTCEISGDLWRFEMEITTQFQFVCTLYDGSKHSSLLNDKLVIGNMETFIPATTCLGVISSEIGKEIGLDNGEFTDQLIRKCNSR